MVELDEGVDQDVENLSDHIKVAFGVSWKEELCEGKDLGGDGEAGSPALLVISTSALRSLELLRLFSVSQISPLLFIIYTNVAKLMNCRKYIQYFFFYRSV